MPTVTYTATANDARAVQKADADSYAVCHDAVDGDSCPTWAPGFWMGQQWKYGAYRIWRGVLRFLAPSFPSVAGNIWVEGTKLHYITEGGITAAKLRVAFYMIYRQTGDYDIVVVCGDDLATSFCTNPCYGDLLDEVISRGSINSADKITNQYYDINLNAAGIAEIKKTGYTYFGMRTSHDISVSPPNANSSDFVSIYVAGYDYPIQLVVTYEGGERAFEGTDTGSNGTAGHLWVEGTYLHYIDENGDERRQEGIKEGATGRATGQMWIESTKLRYIDASGDERYIEGTLV